MHNIMKWNHGTVEPMPGGHSDIYWCKVKSGPTIFLKEGDESLCSLCGQRLFDDPNPHEFVGHIAFQKVA